MTSPLRGLSIAVKLPLLIAGLLVVGVAAGVAVTYHTVREAATTATRERLVLVTDQVSGTLTAAATQLRARIRIAARSPAVIAAALHPGVASFRPANAFLRTVKRTDSDVVALELRDRHGVDLLSAGDAAPWSDAGEDSPVLREALARDSVIIGPLRSVASTVIYAVAAPVQAGSTDVGALFGWVRVRSSPDIGRRFHSIIGTGGQVFLGSPRDSVWTDFTARTPAPSAPLTMRPGPFEYDRPGVGATFAMVRTVTGTPWVLLVQSSRDYTPGATARFLRRQLIISGTLLLVLLVGTWFLSRTITHPLTALTTATEAVAAGRFDHRVGTRRRTDELGRLAESFDAMVTEVRMSHERLEARVAERTGELRERNEELEAYGYSLAHDLRAPLRAMQGFSQALLEDYGPRLDDTGRHYAQVVSDSARTMDRMIQDLLSYSRIARSDVTPASVDLRRVVDRARSQVKAASEERSARITVDPELPAVRGHEATLVQVFANLIGNAVKFVPADRVPQVHVSASTDGGRVRVVVEDNGIGIDPKYHERIFRVFERLNGADEFPGTGIGLAIVRKAVEKMGGSVGVESVPGSGSRFRVDLPQACEDANDART